MIEFGDIQDVHYLEDKTIIVLKVDKNIEEKIERQRSDVVEIRFNDKRLISADQRKKAYAMIADVCYWTGDDTEYMKEVFKGMLRAKLGIEDFSLSNCSMSVAREYITLIIDICLEFNIPTRKPLIEYSDDIDAYLHLCLKHRRCAITGDPGADIHHVIGSRVGMGANRHEVSHAGRKLIALNREWHTKVHMEGEEKIFKDHKIYGVTATHAVLKNLGLARSWEFGIGELAEDLEGKSMGQVVDVLDADRYLVELYNKGRKEFKEIKLKGLAKI